MLKRLIPAILVALAFTACGDDEGNEPAPIEDFGLADMPVSDLSDASDMGVSDDGSELPTTGISITPVEKSVKIAEDFRFNAEARDENLAVVEMPELAWASDDESIVTIDNTGLARGVAEGKTNVRVTWGEFEAAAEVRVVGRFNNITAGSNHTCGRTTAGSVLCWGANNESQLGVDSDDSTPFAVLLDFDTPMFSLAAGDTHTCGLDANGQAYCWGANDYGQLGDGTTNPSTQPVAVSGNVQFALLRAGGDTTCGTTVEVETYCWGRNDFGQVGAGVATARITEPTVVAGGYAFDDVSLGANHVCVERRFRRPTRSMDGIAGVRCRCGTNTQLCGASRPDHGVLGRLVGPWGRYGHGIRHTGSCHGSYGHSVRHCIRRRGPLLRWNDKCQRALLGTQRPRTARRWQRR